MLAVYEIADLLLSVTWALLRVSGVVLIAPILGAVFVPMRLRILIAAVIAFAMLPAIGELPSVSPFSPLGFLAVAREILIGLAIGFIMKLVVEAATFAGQVVSTGMGLSFAMVVDPQAGSVPLLGRLYIITATLLLLATNAHLMLIAAVGESYSLLPIGEATITAASAMDLARFGSVIFTGAMHLAMPAVIAILMVNVAFGVVSRAAPTLNLFAVGFPVTLMLGFIVLTLSTRTQIPIWQRLFDDALLMTGRVLTGGLSVAENPQDFQERTERATPKRLEEARKKGQVPRSKELNMAAVMISASLVFFAIQPQLGTHLLALLRRGLSIDPAQLRDTASMSAALAEAGVSTLSAFAPLLAVVTVAAMGGGVALGGLSFSTHPLEPKLSKLNPLKGLKRLFGLKGLVEVGKALAKAGLIGGVAVLYLAASAQDVLTLGLQSIDITMASSGQLVTTTLMICSLSLLLIALVDVPYQLWNHQKELRMTRKEVQDEMKETEGRPEVRSRVRQLQQQLSDRRMIEAVPAADVIITNPTHFAVALRYQEGDMRAPQVVAKGVDHMAARIRAIAADNKVAQFEAPLLARALYWTTEVGQEIPHQLYLAVAQVLTYVFRLKAAAENRGEWPDRPVVKVDEDLAKRPERRPRRRR